MLDSALYLGDFAIQRRSDEGVRRGHVAIGLREDPPSATRSPQPQHHSSAWTTGPPNEGI